MGNPDDLLSPHDNLGKNKKLSSLIILNYTKDLLSHFKQIPVRNDRKVCPEPCFHFSTKTFLPPDQQYPGFSNFDPLKISKHLGEKEVDQDSDLEVINDSKLSPKIDRQLEDQLDVVQILANLVKDKNIDQLVQFGGVKGLASSLCTNLRYGIHSDREEVSRRQEVFGSNTYCTPPTKSVFSLFLEGLIEDPAILFLLICEIFSAGFGMKTDGPKEGWDDGQSIVMVVLILNYVFAVRYFWREDQLNKFALKCNENIQIEVVRSGERKQIPVFQAVVGDIVCLKNGNQVPGDGVFWDGHSLTIDESSMTGESDFVEVNSRNPFLISGTKVADGYGTMLITSVGMNTTWGKMMSGITNDSNEDTPLQARLKKLTTSIGKVGLVVAFLVLVVLLVRYFTGNTQNDDGKKEYIGSKTKTDDTINAIFRIIASAVTISVVAIPVGFPLAVTLILAYSIKRMLADKAMVRRRFACETMGSATTICTDKTGTLTMNMMTVKKFWFGQESIEKGSSSFVPDNNISLLQQAVGLNTTASVYKPSTGSEYKFSGSPTEKSIFSWAVLDLKMDIEDLKKCFTLLHVEAFNSEKKMSGVLIKKNADNTVHAHWKGDAEMILARCSHYYNQFGEIKALDDTERKKFELLIQGMAASSLRCIAFAYKQVTKYVENRKEVDDKIQDKGLVLLGLIGIEDPCRPSLKKAIEVCLHAGVSVKMITGDNVFTARAIATECGILRPNQEVENGQVVEGVEFRNYTPEERMEKVDKICVMARSSPFDKLLMVQSLREKGHVVAVTGDGTNDAPALKEADIGLSMGIQGTEVAKESSDIVILDDNFASVATVLGWGRCVNNNIQKIIQFQCTVSVAALVINLVSMVSACEVPLTAVQLLWVNHIMGTLGALALATEKPTKELMVKCPVGLTEPLITNIMWRNLIAQVWYQIGILLTIQFAGEEIFTVNDRVKDTLIFNTFALCQVFNLVNARKFDQLNIFTRLHRNKLFLGIIMFVLVIQVVMVEFLNKFAHTERLKWGQWGVCIAFAVVSWPLGCIVKLIPVPAKSFASLLKMRT